MFRIRQISKWITLLLVGIFLYSPLVTFEFIEDEEFEQKEERRTEIEEKEERLKEKPENYYFLFGELPKSESPYRKHQYQPAKVSSLFNELRTSKCVIYILHCALRLDL